MKDLLFKFLKTRNFVLLLLAFLMFACNSEQKTNLSPGETLKQYVAAAQKKDSAAMKGFLSKGSIEFLDKSAKSKNISVDELLRMEADVQAQQIPETRNEIIEGDTATVEVKNTVTGAFDIKLPFVKEENAWKIARDKYIAEQIKMLNDQMNIPVENSNSNAANK